jgi:hypothetical protein
MNLIFWTFSLHRRVLGEVPAAHVLLICYSYKVCYFIPVDGLSCNEQTSSVYHLNECQVRVPCSTTISCKIVLKAFQAQRTRLFCSLGC